MVAGVMTMGRRRPLGSWLSLMAAALLLALIGCAPVAHAQSAGTVLPVPALSGQVIDSSGTLSGSDRQALTQQLAQAEQTLGSQIVILMVPSTQPEDIAAYANRVADTWKIGRKTVGDGLLIVVAVQDRRMRIEVARALEGAVPDLAAYRIIEETLKPAFRQGEYAQGLSQAVTQLTGLIKGEALPAPAPHAAAGDEPFDPASLGVFLLIAVPVAGGMLNNIFGRKLGSALIAVGTAGLVWFFTASLIFAVLAGVLAVVLAAAIAGGGGGRGGGLGGGPVIFPGGGSGRSGGGGGFSSGGGGSFGGGGASGGW